MGLIVNPYRFAAAGGGGTVATITIASGKVASDLADYPVYVDLADMPSGFWSGVASDGSNIRVKQAGSDIPFDVVKIDTSGHTGTLFFKAASLLAASSNVFTVDLGGASAPAFTDTNGRNAVWSAYDFVCLLEDTTTYIDRTGGAAGSKATGTVSSSPIALGAGLGLDFVNARLVFGTHTSRNVFTFGVTCNLDVSDPISANYTAFSYGSSTINRLNILARNNGSLDSWNEWDNNNTWISANTGATITAGQSRRLHCVYDNTAYRKLYIDGALNTTATGITARSSDNTYVLGQNYGGTEPFDGKIGFAYARPQILSADYIAAEYSNLNAPSSFYTIT